MAEASVNISDHQKLEYANAIGESTARLPSLDPPDADDPVCRAPGRWPDNASGWMRRHLELVAVVQKASPRVVFIGDSITECWAKTGEAEWSLRFEPLNSVNLGIGGDRTQQILWRLASGALDRANPELVVLMIGVNNLWHDVNTFGVARVARGIRHITSEICDRCPSAKVLLLGILPTQEKADHPLRSIVRQVNAATCALHAGDAGRVRFVDFESLFLEPDDTILPSIMPDFCHLSEEGYNRFGRSLEPVIHEMLGDDKRRPWIK